MSSEETVTVPRDLLCRVRCDLLLAYSELESQTSPVTTQAVADMLRADRAELLAYVPYRHDQAVQDSLTESLDVGESVKQP